MRKRVWIRIALLATIVVTAAAKHGGIPRRLEAQAHAQPTKISIENFSFTPKNIAVAKGTQVVWVNRDDIPHTVVSTDRKFKSMALDTDDEFSFTFTDAGTYNYFCSVHPMMTGKIVVK